ncbi:hypothetical protein SEUCBS140593_008332 [Sporothrix eucalyptigena]|uniref:Uncharacterized protein n=1 Tax=Sporothrix eucalyptigena TaxID=1812306 RepID=A0ABP0CKL5_9PEZI
MFDSAADEIRELEEMEAMEEGTIQLVDDDEEEQPLTGLDYYHETYFRKFLLIVAFVGMYVVEEECLELFIMIFVVDRLIESHMRQRRDDHAARDRAERLVTEVIYGQEVATKDSHFDEKKAMLKDDCIDEKAIVEELKDN